MSSPPLRHPPTMPPRPHHPTPRLARHPAAALPARSLKARLALLALTSVLCAAASPAAAGMARPEKAKLALQADRTAYEAGATARISALVAIDPGWHVNSHNPTFDYLIPTVLELELPPSWPRPVVEYPPAQKKSFTFADVPLSVYDGDVVIQARVRILAGTSRGVFPIRARLQYQACNDSQCLPPVTAQSQVSLTVVSSAAAPDVSSGSSAGPMPTLAASSAAPAPLPGHRPASFSNAGPPSASAGSTATAVPEVHGAGAARSTSQSGPPASAASRGRATLISGAAAKRAGAKAPAGPSAGRRPAVAGARPAPPLGSLAAMLLVAVLGGLILNAMPCVLPILSLKVFGMMRSAGQGRREVVRGSLATAAGILVSFWALAALAVAAAAAGAAVGWGVQFQRPGFVAFLLVAVTLFCLNLWGLFEIHLPVALANLGGTGAREGLAGHFGYGLFATLMATPCSAPFLGTAIGFALAQPAPVIFAIFTAVGTGLALPYLVLAAAPGVARLLPRPGAWMETLRGTLGFVLAASAVWLLYVLAAEVSPERLALVEVGLLAIALCVWVRHRAAAGRPAAAPAAAFAAAAGAGGTIALAAAGGGAAAVDARLAAHGPSAGLIGWVAFDRARAESLAAGGQLVFVDVTADWCFTCKVNERLILDTPEIAGAFARHHVLPMRADWTKRSDEIAQFLAEHGRYGIPFYMLYRPGHDPYVFSELPTKASILAALEAAAPTGAGTQASRL